MSSLFPREQVPLRDGEPCANPQCLACVTQPCERCGRMRGHVIGISAVETTHTWRGTTMTIRCGATILYQGSAEECPKGWLKALNM